MPPHSASQALTPGIKLGSYVIQKILGANMHAFTYQAFDRELKRDVIIKESFPIEIAYRNPDNLMVLPRHQKQEEEFRTHLKNFLEQSQLLASLDHPGIITTLNVYEALGTAYSVLSFVPGNSLEVETEKRRHAGSPWTASDIIRITGQILESVKYLHLKKILHRDIRPAHFLLTPAGNPVLIGFGRTHSRTAEGDVTIIVSPDCAAPEQILNSAPYDERSEIYALGATFHKLLLNTYPQRADLRFYSHSTSGLAEKTELSEKFSASFLRSIDRALNTERENRFSSVSEWLKAIDEDLDAAARTREDGRKNPSGAVMTEHLVHETAPIKRSLVDEDDEEEESPRKRRRQKRTRQRKSPLQHIKEFFLKKENDEDEEY